VTKLPSRKAGIDDRNRFTSQSRIRRCCCLVLSHWLHFTNSNLEPSLLITRQWKLGIVSVTKWFPGLVLGPLHRTTITGASPGLWRGHLLKNPGFSRSISKISHTPLGDAPELPIRCYWRGGSFICHLMLTT
jgi:hypothetical protein